jgi:hypothetical protein
MCSRPPPPKGISSNDSDRHQVLLHHFSQEGQHLKKPPHKLEYSLAVTAAQGNKAHLAAEGEIPAKDVVVDLHLKEDSKALVNGRGAGQYGQQR